MRTRIVSGLLAILLALGVVGFQGSVMALDLGIGSEEAQTLDELTETLETTYTTLPPGITDAIHEMTENQCAFGKRVLESHGYSAPNVTHYGFEYDILSGECREFRDALQHAVYQDEKLPYAEACRTTQGFTTCVALGHYACDFAIYAVNGLVYVCKGGLTPYN